MNEKQRQIVAARNAAKPDAETITMAHTPSAVLEITWSAHEVGAALDAATKGDEPILQCVEGGVTPTYRVIRRN